MTSELISSATSKAWITRSRVSMLTATPRPWLPVVGGTLVAASRRDPPQVTGDGVQTIRQLVDQVNADPLRGDGHATSLTKIRFDDIALATLKKQGFDADSVPPPGTLIFLRNNANLSTGGSATDLSLIHI